MATSGQIEKIVTVLSAMFPKDVAFLTEAQMGARVVMYCRLLADIDADMLGLAVDQYIASGGTAYPSVKQLRDMALSLAQVADDAPDAASAWRMACNAIEPWMDGAQWRAGAREKLHPRVIAAIEAYDMRRIAIRQEQNAGTDFAQWRGLYESLAGRADEQARWLPQVRERIALMRAEMDAAKPAQIIAPADAVPVDAASSAAAKPAEGGAPVRLADLLNVGAPALTKEQLDRRAHAARLIARRDALRDALAGEADETKRRAIEVQIDGITRTVAQYEVQT